MISNIKEKKSSLSPHLSEGELPSSLEDQVDSIEGSDDNQPLADESMLIDRVPDWMKMSPTAATWTAVIGGLFLLLSYLPLWHADLWGHVSYGRAIWTAGQIPATEALLPLANGVPIVDSSWMSQVVMYLMEAQFGFAGIQFLYALCITVAIGVLMRWSYLRTGSVKTSLLGLAAFLLVSWGSLRAAQPVLAGVACYSVLLTMLMSRKWNPRNWIYVPVLFGVWANLHISWTIGLVLLACFTVGRACDVLLRTKNVCCALTNFKTVRTFMLFELAAIAVLINPYGLGVYFDAWALIQNRNLSDLFIYDPLTLRSFAGIAVAAVGVVALIVFRFTPRRIQTAEAIVLVGFLIAAMWSSHLLLWWGPVAALFLVRHLAAIWKKYPTENLSEEDLEEDLEEGDSLRSGLWTIVTIGLAWIFFAYTPFGMTLLHGQPKELEKQIQREKRSVSKLTPAAAVRYWNEHSKPGLIYNAFEWGDYLIYKGTSNTQIFVGSQVQNLPREVWNDYLHISRMGSSWEDKLDRYGVNVIFIDHASRTSMINQLKRNMNWKLDYDDGVAVIFLRRKPIGNFEN